MKKEFVSRQPVGLLPERVRKIASKELNLYIRDLIEKKYPVSLKMLFVAEGEEQSVALLEKYVILEMEPTTSVEVVTPQAAVRLLTRFDEIDNGMWSPKYDLVIGFSYSGKKPNLEQVAEICNKKGFEFLLVTETEIFNNQEAAEEGKKFVSQLNIAEIAKDIKQNQNIHVFYQWNTFPTAVDIKNMFTGIATVILHNKIKEGYTSLSHLNFSAVINLTVYGKGENSEGKCYKCGDDARIANSLKELCKTKYIEMGTAEDMPSQWNIEAMAKIPYFITSICEELGIDI